MDAYRFQLLEQIERGETEFKTESDLKAFRRVLQGLRGLQKSGHIEILELRESATSNSIAKAYDSALVSLTEFGKRDLAAQSERKMKREK
jgi:hypothetical protein